MSDLEQKIAADLNLAMKEKNEVKVGTLRLLRSAIEKEKKSGKAELTEEEILKIIRSEVKKRQEAAVSFTEGGRAELAEKENQELAELQVYLPPELSADELKKLVSQVISQNNFTATDFGLAMKQVVSEVAGRADGSRVAAEVKSQLK